MRKVELFVVLGMLAAAAPAMAQSRGKGNDGVPPGQRPRAGMCRIWVDGLPPGQQPAPTDCATARARVPSNGRILFGSRTQSNRHLNTSNGQVVGVNGQPCVQRADQNGTLRTLCRDMNASSEDRADRNDDDRDNHKGKKLKKPKGDRDD
ncbi:MAG: hypothetical protein JWM41_4562 [Gemmatimonadetes bacterium]|nr:hypothetical protein [Gemmatimonadota bacterium]